MAFAAKALNLLTFAQRWIPATAQGDDAYLLLHVLVVPRGDLLNASAGSTAFADAQLSLTACVVPGLAALPTPTLVTDRVSLTIEQPANRRALLEILGTKFNVRQSAPLSAPPPASRHISKFLAPSYQAATNQSRPRTRFSVTNDAYECMLKDAMPAGKPPQTPDNRFYWEEVVAFVLRQPLLARATGLVYEVRLPLANPELLTSGGFVYVEPAAASPFSSSADHECYATRIPKLPHPDNEQALFTPVLFPLSAKNELDEVVAEASDYASGFARVVHGAQPQRAAQVDADGSTLRPGELAPPKDAGVQLGWDDEQLLIWYNRQFGTHACSESKVPPNAPLGVGGYRIDVREDKPGEDWHSMVRVKGDLQLDAIALGHFDGEQTIDVFPVNHMLNEEKGFWLPSYFTAWRGTSLVVTDPLPYRIANRPDALLASPFTAVGAEAVPLRYGRNYQFRVRLADLTGGGPGEADSPQADAPVPTTTIAFRRSVPPGAVTIETGGGLSADKRSATFRVARPQLGYPDIVYTGFPDAIDLLLAKAVAESAEHRENTLPDPDAKRLRVEVQVRSLDHDPTAQPESAPYLSLYSTTYDFPIDPAEALELKAQFEDTQQVDILRGVGLGLNEPLRLPTARDIRLVISATDEPDAAQKYWRSDQARLGAPFSVYISAPSRDETDLLQAGPGRKMIQGIYLQPDRALLAGALAEQGAGGLQHETFTDCAARLAAHLNLSCEEATFRAKPERRLVFGAAQGLLHTLNPDGSSITFASRDELTRRWLIPVSLQIERDWTWNGLAPEGLEIRRDGKRVGTVRFPRTVSGSVGANPHRASTEVLFFDVFDPKPAVGQFPQESQFRYEVVPNFASPPEQADANLQWDLRLPVTTVPTQTPRLVSAGIAFSPFEREKEYSSTGERQRALYFEFDRAPDDPQDTYFARVLAYAPDPMLTRHAEVPTQREPPLPVDPEPLRFIVPGGSNDGAGLGAMQTLVSGGDGLRYLLPLPEGFAPESSELFGFFVYELRVGHDEFRWCTAQGRYGLPLRVAGVQHPAPQLRCSAVRDRAGVRVLAPYAAPILNGRNIRPVDPATSLHALLYAQVQQADGVSWRNVLLKTARAKIERPHVHRDDRYDYRFDQAVANFNQSEIKDRLVMLGLPVNAPLSVMTAEMLPEPAGEPSKPLSEDLGSVRIYRTSPLTPVPEICSPLPAAV